MSMVLELSNDKSSRFLLTSDAHVLKDIYIFNEKYVPTKALKTIFHI